MFFITESLSFNIIAHVNCFVSDFENSFSEGTVDEKAMWESWGKMRKIYFWEEQLFAQKKVTGMVVSPLCLLWGMQNFASNWMVPGLLYLINIRFSGMEKDK